MSNNYKVDDHINKFNPMISNDVSPFGSSYY
jgi:hypothetical protein